MPHYITTPTAEMQRKLCTGLSRIWVYEALEEDTPLILPEDIIRMSYDAGFPEEVNIGGVSSASVEILASGEWKLLNRKIRVALYAEDITDPYLVGSFIVTACESDGKTTTITAYDGASLLNREYIPHVEKAADGRYSARSIVTELAAQCAAAQPVTGAILSAEPENLPEGWIYLSGDITGRTCAEMLGDIAALGGQNVLITNEGKVKFIMMELLDLALPDGGDRITADYTYEGQMKVGGSCLPAKIVCTAEGDRVLTSQINENGVFNLYTTNPYMTQERLDEAAELLSLMSICHVGSCAYFGGGFVRPGHVVQVRSEEGEEYYLFAASVHIEFDGGIRTEFSSSYSAEDADPGSVSASGAASDAMVSRLNRLEQKVRSLYNGSGTWNALTLEEGISVPAANYGGSPIGRPAYCVRGGICRLAGNVNAAYLGKSLLLATLPEEACPRGNVYRLVPCGGKRMARLYVNSAGLLRLEWLVNLSDGANYTTATWIQLNMEYPVKATDYDWFDDDIQDPEGEGGSGRGAFPMLEL